MTIKARAARWLREPLVHFLLLGGLVYAVMAGRAPDPGEQRIVVDQAVVSQLVGRWQQTFRRLPTQQETDGLIRDYVKGEVYYREALRLGLDRDDEAVRRLMRNKLVTTLTADAEARRPSNADLQALLDKEPARYVGGAMLDFEQIYLGEANAAIRAVAGQAARTLNNGGSRAGIGVPAPLPGRLSSASTSEIDGLFGEGFANSLQALSVGNWATVPSGLGLHLVRVTRRIAPIKPRLNDVRQRVENDWRSAALAAAEDKRYREMLKGYDVITRLD